LRKTFFRKEIKMDAQLKKEVENIIVEWLIWFHRDLVDHGQIPAVTLGLNGEVVKKEFVDERRLRGC
jgi:alpha-L-arabinofuranosidase